MSIKNTGKFGLAYQVLNEDGEKIGVRMRITADIVLKQGQTVFFNDFEEDINGLATKNIITAEEATAKILQRVALDGKYNQKTLYSVRAGKLPEAVVANTGNTL